MKESASRESVQQEKINSGVSEEKTEITQGPWFVVNHITKKKEKLFISKNNQLCLEGEDGKLTWKKPFTEEIKGEVTQIDSLKNGKLQMEFTTKAGL